MWKTLIITSLIIHNYQQKGVKKFYTYIYEQKHKSYKALFNTFLLDY